LRFLGSSKNRNIPVGERGISRFELFEKNRDLVAVGSAKGVKDEGFGHNCGSETRVKNRSHAIRPLYKFQAMLGDTYIRK
jgi:hypothetical protein